MKMSIVVVDDETPICEWLLYCIQRISPDYQVHAAHNGEEACTLILQEKPDIVFTDIRMPTMDGLELMKRVLAKLPYTVFAILTNHAEFSYAKQAVSLGAREYYLKSELRAADIEEFIAGVVKRKETLEAEKKGGDILPSGCIDLYSLYKNSDKPDFADNFWESHGMDSQAPYVVLAVKSTHDPQTWQLLAQAPQKVLPQGQAGLYMAVGSTRGNHYIVLQAADARQLDALAEPLARAILTDISLSVGISPQSAVRAHFEAVARQAHTALEAIFFSRPGIFYYTTLPRGALLEREKLRQGKRAILDLLAQHRFGDCALALEIWFDSFARMGTEDVEWSIDYCRRMVLAIEERYYQQNETHAQQIEVQDSLSACKSRCAALVAQMETQQAGQCSAAVETALQYIHQHYMQPISMAEVARQVYRSPEYFSRQFKEEVGENFSVYLTLYRLSRAQELLRATNHRVSEIAEMVGYTTPGYFSRLYKKYKGIVPDEERRSKL